MKNKFFVGRNDGTGTKKSFCTLEEAEQEIDRIAVLDSKGVAAGEYYIDGPDELINKVSSTYTVRYQLHKCTDLSDNPTPRNWKIKAETPEQAFNIAQQRAAGKRAIGIKVGHVYREVVMPDGKIHVCEGNYL